MARQVLTEGSKHAISTARAKREGFKSFKTGSAGDKRRDEIAESIARKTKIVKGPQRLMAAVDRRITRRK